MAITPMKAAFTVVEIDKEITDLDTTTIDKLLFGKVFLPIDATAEEKSYGWVTLPDINDLEFVNTTAIGSYHFFGLRIDKRNVPAATLRNEVTKMIEREMAQIGRSLSRERKREIKEQAKLKLLARIPPVPKVIQCLISREDNLLYIGSTSKADIELVLDQVTETFDAAYEPIAPINRIEKVLKSEVFADIISGLEKDTGNSDYTLWKEFMLWLWWASETKSAVAEIGAHKYHFWVDGDIEVHEWRGKTLTNKFVYKTKDDSYTYDDVKYSLWKEEHRYPSKMTYVFEIDEETTYVMSLDATKYSGVALKTPPVSLHGSGIQDEAPMLEKIYHIEAGMNFLEHQFLNFTKIRFNATNWEAHTKLIHSWLEESAPECERSLDINGTPQQ